jgi:hypothetical protein
MSVFKSIYGISHFYKIVGLKNGLKNLPFAGKIMVDNKITLIK